jgi:hypothetical protein
MKKQKTVYSRQAMIDWLDAISKAFELQTANIRVTWKRKHDWEDPTQIWKILVHFK